ncbi:hypothetical protein EBS43_06160 [bacterium]|jgi:2-desacetyl-2-hydroxyethyl bacteriochlorophyllide A dehydrogenase|nr:hypothetical protein [bacterium]
MIKTVQIPRFGDTKVLKMVDQPRSTLTLQGVRIEVKAIGVNFADLMMRMGLYPEAPPLPFVPGYEVAGQVVEIGAGVKTLVPGDRVLAGTRFGGYASEIVAPEYHVRRIPAHLSYEQAAGIPVNFLTAWIALHEMGRVRKGDRVLIPSAAGGVGTAAVQIAAQEGAHVVGVVGSSSKKELVRSLGAQEVITQEEWEFEESAPQKDFQIILDAAGGESLKRSYRRLSSGGRLIHFGASSLVGGPKRSFGRILSFFLNSTFFTTYKLMMDNKGVYGLNMLQLFDEPSIERYNPIFTAFDEVLKKFEEGKYRVIVGKTFPLTQVDQAHSHLQGRESLGKVILLP